jgi:transposase-like protein
VGGEFKWRHFAGELILLCVRWYCRYGISYRDLEEMMAERGVDVDYSTLYRWVQRYARSWRSGRCGTRTGIASPGGSTRPTSASRAGGNTTLLQRS